MSYLSTITELLLQEFLAVNIEDVKSIYANVDFDFIHDNIFPSTCTESLTKTDLLVIWNAIVWMAVPQLKT